MTDKFLLDKNNKYLYSGIVDKTIKFVEQFQLLNELLWKRFANQFSHDADYDAGWRGEYWGKMMRGACLVYSYTQNESLYETTSKSVREILNYQEKSGRISSYSVSHEFDGWDLWGRKYVLLGMQYFVEICKDDELKERIIDSMCRQADYIINRIGDGEGKIPITQATRHWRGLNSSSILEPIVRLYVLTDNKKYFDFAEYIVNTGATDVENIFELAYQNELYPYQYPVTKAYEMISCFEGLLEFYRITGIEKYKKAIINFADKILESDFTVIGSCGSSHELFDHSTVRQANTTNGKTMQETCVTVTLMKFFWQLNRLTGNSKYADAFEISMYNAYLGSVNTEKVIEPKLKIDHPDWTFEPLPFDSYSPLTAGTRGNGIGGLKQMSDNSYYGCCACIGAAGCGLIPKMQMLSTEKGFAVNLYIDGSVKSKTPLGNSIEFSFATKYPEYGKIIINVNAECEEEFEILLRNPEWSKATKVYVNGEEYSAVNGYIKIFRRWKNEDIIELILDMNTRAIYPKPYGNQVLMNKVVWGHNYVVPTFDREDPLAKNHIALQRGPIMLAQEQRLGYNVDTPVKIKADENGIVKAVVPDKDTAPYEHIVEVKVPLENGEYMTLTDYSSAGKLWNSKSKLAVWILTEGQ